MMRFIQTLSIRLVTMRLYEPSLIDQTVLALIGEHPRHGFGVSKELQHDESLSAVLRIRRPLVYRAINALLEAKLIKITKTEPGDQGSHRTVYSITARGKKISEAWLNEIVTHPRDARLELLGKFVLRSRRGLSNRSLAKQQSKAFRVIAVELDSFAATATKSASLVAQWRAESIHAMIRVLDVASITN